MPPRLSITAWAWINATGILDSPLALHGALLFSLSLRESLRLIQDRTASLSRREIHNRRHSNSKMTEHMCSQWRARQGVITTAAVALLRLSYDAVASFTSPSTLIAGLSPPKRSFVAWRHTRETKLQAFGGSNSTVGGRGDGLDLVDLNDLVIASSATSSSRKGVFGSLLYDGSISDEVSFGDLDLSLDGARRSGSSSRLLSFDNEQYFLQRATMDLVSCLDLTPNEARSFLNDNPELLSVYHDDYDYAYAYFPKNTSISTTNVAPLSSPSDVSDRYLDIVPTPASKERSPIMSKSVRRRRRKRDLLSQLLFFQNEMGISRERLTRMMIQHPKLLASTFLDHQQDMKTTMDILREWLKYHPDDEEWQSVFLGDDDVEESNFQQFVVRDSSSSNYRRHSRTSPGSKLRQEAIRHCAGGSRVELRQKLSVLSQSGTVTSTSSNLSVLGVGCTTNELRTLLLNHPKVLTLSSDTLLNSLHILQAQLGLTQADCKGLWVRYASVLCCCLDQNHCSLTKLLDFIKTELLFLQSAGKKGPLSTDGKNLVRNILVECPHLLVLPIETRIAPVMRFLRYDILQDNPQRQELQQQEHTNKKRTPKKGMTAVQRRAAKRSSTTNVKSDYASAGIKETRLAAMQAHENISLVKRQLRTVIETLPNVLSYSVGNNLKPKVQFLQDTLELSPEDLRRLIVKEPEILSLSLANNLRPKLEYFLRPVTLAGGDTAENLYTRELDLSQGLGFTPAELRRVCVANPSFMRLSLEKNLKGKIQGWQSEMKLTYEEMKEFVLAHPKLLSDDMDPLMRRRIKVFKNIRGRGVSLIDVPLSILSGSEYMYQKWCVLRSKKKYLVPFFATIIAAIFLAANVCVRFILQDKVIPLRVIELPCTFSVLDSKRSGLGCICRRPKAFRSSVHTKW
jgi:hypothetical protein